MPENSQKINLIQLTQFLFYFLAASWLVEGLISLARSSQTDLPDQPISLLVMALLLLVNVAALFTSGLGLGKAKKSYYYFALIVLTVNLILTITDKIGLFDLFTLFLNLLILALLTKTRKLFSH